MFFEQEEVFDWPKFPNLTFSGVRNLSFTDYLQSCKPSCCDIAGCIEEGGKQNKCKEQQLILVVMMYTTYIFVCFKKMPNILNSQKNGLSSTTL